MSTDEQSRRRRITAWLARNSGNALLGGIIVTVLGAVVTGLVTVMVSELTEEEKPPGCPGEACDGRNPQDEGCGGDAGSWKPVGSNPAMLEIRYSARCQAVWGRINAGEPGDRVTVQAVGGPLRESPIDYGNDQFTRMVGITDPDDFRVKVCALPGSGADHKGTWKTYCIQATEATTWR